MLPLQAMGRRRGGARLLDHDRNGPHAGSLGTPGSGCARLPSFSEISGSTPRTNRLCSRASRATSSCVRRGTSSKSACFLAARRRLLRCDASIAHRSTRSFTSFRSGTGTRCKRPSPTGFGRHTDCLTCWPRTLTRSAPTRHRNLDRSRRKRRPLGEASPPGSQSGGNHETIDHPVAGISACFRQP